MDDYVSALVTEMEHLSQFERHPNIVGLIKVCTVGSKSIREIFDEWLCKLSLPLPIVSPISSCDMPICHWFIHVHVCECILLLYSSLIIFFISFSLIIEPVYMIMEYMCHGDLLGFLRATRGHPDMYTVFPGTKNIPSNLKLKSRDLLRIISQIADGMNYLSGLKVRETERGF